MDVNTHLECLELRIFGILTRFLSVEGGAPRHPSRGSYSAHRHLQVSHYTFIQVASAEGLSIFGLITFAVTSNSLWDSFVSIAKDQIVAALTSLRPTLTQFIWQKTAKVKVKHGIVDVHLMSYLLLLLGNLYCSLGLNKPVFPFGR